MRIKIITLFIFLNSQIFAYEVLEKSSGKYFAVSDCGPILDKSSKIYYIECNDNTQTKKEIEGKCSKKLINSCAPIIFEPNPQIRADHY